ncbi:hypothetical protein LSH36_322g00014 [Paralvinella palmiformis]|uniref:Uncharacterized protein n=1 Tax=Paralvinella palmiformis TaxID=53620 RepID=A0AAD9JGD8_9ANNE|nr:hypothetical protein LSH36_322g00014 [Paralvinella palmiformis]
MILIGVREMGYANKGRVTTLLVLVHPQSNGRTERLNRILKVNDLIS